MDLKKEILSDLKKYNKDLDSHLSGLNFDSLNSISKEDDKDDEYFKLLGSNLVDLRTELALMRKNLSVEIEGMVLKAISNQQNTFLKQANDFYSTVLTQMKSNFSDYVKDINSQIQNLKKDLNTINLNNKDFSNKISIFNEELLNFKLIMERFEDSNLKSKELVSDLKLDIEDLNRNLSKLSFSIGDQKNYLSNSLLVLNKKLEMINKNISNNFNLDELNNKLNLILKDYNLLEHKFNNLSGQLSILGENSNSLKDIFSQLDLIKKEIPNSKLIKKISSNISKEDFKLEKELKKIKSKLKSLNESSLSSENFNIVEKELKDDISKKISSLNLKLSNENNFLTHISKENLNLNNLSNSKSIFLENKYEKLNKKLKSESSDNSKSLKQISDKISSLKNTGLKVGKNSLKNLDVANRLEILDEKREILSRKINNSSFNLPKPIGVEKVDFKLSSDKLLDIDLKLEQLEKLRN